MKNEGRTVYEERRTADIVKIMLDMGRNKDYALVVMGRMWASSTVGGAFDLRNFDLGSG